MKKLFIGIISMFSILAGTSTVVTAKNDKNLSALSVRLIENTLVVSASQLTEARLYTYRGQLLSKETGNYLTFDLEQGTYVLFADVNGETLARKVILK